jgi:excisionase family DNA binding protein
VEYQSRYLTDDDLAHGRAAVARRVLKNATNLYVDEQPLTVEQLSSWLQVKPSTVYEWTRSRSTGKHSKPLPVVKVGRQLRFSKKDVIEWLNEQHNQN